MIARNSIYFLNFWKEDSVESEIYLVGEENNFYF